MAFITASGEVSVAGVRVGKALLPSAARRSSAANPPNSTRPMEVQ